LFNNVIKENYPKKKTKINENKSAHITFTLKKDYRPNIAPSGNPWYLRYRLLGA